MPRLSRLSNSQSSKPKSLKKKYNDSDVKTVLSDFDKKVVGKLEEFDDKIVGCCDDITRACTTILSRIPKNHRKMLILDYIEMKNNEKAEMSDILGSSDDVFELVKVAPTRSTKATDSGPSSSGSSPLRSVKPSTLKKRLRGKMAISVENLSSTHNRDRGTSQQRSTRSQSVKERSASESRATPGTRSRSRKRNKETPVALSGAFSAIRLHSQKRTPNVNSSTPLRACRPGERCLILSESGSPLSSDTMVLPIKDGVPVTISSSNLDILDDDTRGSLLHMHQQMVKLLGGQK